MRWENADLLVHCCLNFALEAIFCWTESYSNHDNIRSDTSKATRNVVLKKKAGRLETKNWLRSRSERLKGGATIIEDKDFEADPLTAFLDILIVQLTKSWL